MAAFYLDTSAVLKRYTQERGTAWLQRLTDPRARHLLYTVRLTGPEMIAAVYRKARMGEIGLVDARNAANAFRQHWRHEYAIIEVSVATADRAMNIAEQHSLRGYDAVHLAATLEMQVERARRGMPPLTFISADAEQLRAAVAEGLPVDDPNVHP